MATDIRMRDIYYLTRQQYNDKKAAGTLEVGAQYCIVDEYYAGSSTPGGAATTAQKVQNTLTFGDKTFDGSSAQTITAADLHIIDALQFMGTTTTDIVTNSTDNVITIVGKTGTYTAQSGCVVIYNNRQYFWDTVTSSGQWTAIGTGDGSTYKIKQAEVLDSNATTLSTTASTFVSSITQDSNGNITVTKAPVEASSFQPATVSAAGIVSTTDQSFGGNKSFQGDVLPTADSTYSLGSTDARWLGTWTDAINGINTDNFIFFDDSGTLQPVSTTVTNNAIARFDGTAGAIQNSLATISDDGNITAVGFIGDVTGNASSADKLSTARTISLTGVVTGSGEFDGSGNLSITTSTGSNFDYLPLTGGTMTGAIQRAVTGCSWIAGRDSAIIKNVQNNNSNLWFPTVSSKSVTGSWETGAFSDDYYFVYSSDANYTDNINNAVTTVHISTSGGIYGAVWNDYAEFREAETIEPGRCVREDESGVMKVTTNRLMPGCEIISDTFGVSIGQTNKCQTPIAVSGRVLAYTDKDRNTFKLGMPVCSGPDGTVSQMTEVEARVYPWCIIGTVSEIPDYAEWGSGKVKVNDRIWIRVR